MRATTWIAWAAAVVTAACGGSDGSGGSSGSGASASTKSGGCNRAGEWTVTYTLTAGGAMCQELPSQTVHDDGHAFSGADACTDSCSCTSDVSTATCSGTIAHQCSGAGGSYSLGCNVSASSDTLLTGTCTFDMTAPIAVSCTYGVKYEWAGP